MFFKLLKSLMSIINLLALLITLYLAKIAYSTDNFVAFNFMLYLVFVLAFHWAYQFFRWIKGKKSNSKLKYIFAYLSFVSFSTLIFIISQWYLVDNVQLKNFYKNFQGNFTQALKK